MPNLKFPLKLATVRTLWISTYRDCRLSVIVGLCDHTVTNGTGTWALDTQHLQYSCREFALNCAQDRTCTPEVSRERVRNRRLCVVLLFCSAQSPPGIITL